LPVVAGRDALLDHVARVMEVGPEHPRFCRAIRGGKTVLLDVIGELGSNELGRAMLHVQVLQEESLVAILLQRIPEAVRPWGRWLQQEGEVSRQYGVPDSADRPAEGGPEAVDVGQALEPFSGGQLSQL
jgi:hypothetical protein